MDIKTELNHHGIKSTRQREAILMILKDSDTPITINQIRESLDTVGEYMDLSTIYRVLDVFEQKNIITKTVPLEPSQSVYDYKRHIHKHHLICTQCGTITIIEGCPLGDYEGKVSRDSGYIIDRHQLELYGLCPECQKSA